MWSPRLDPPFSPPTPGRKICPAPGRSEHRKTCEVEAVSGAPAEPFQRPTTPVVDSKPQVSGYVRLAEADGNRTRLRALALTPILKFGDGRVAGCYLVPPGAIQSRSAASSSCLVPSC